MAMNDAERARKYRESKRHDTVTEGDFVTRHESDRVQNVTENVTERHEIEPVSVTEDNSETVTASPAEMFDRWGVKVRPRICTQCPGRVFDDREEHIAHLATHNPSPAQWANAYEMIQRGKEARSPRRAGMDAPY